MNPSLERGIEKLSHEQALALRTTEAQGVHRAITERKLNEGGETEGGLPTSYLDIADNRLLGLLEILDVDESVSLEVTGAKLRLQDSEKGRTVSLYFEWVGGSTKVMEFIVAQSWEDRNVFTFADTEHGQVVSFPDIQSPEFVDIIAVERAFLANVDEWQDTLKKFN